MFDFSLIAAEALASKGKKIVFNHNSIFSGMDLSSNDSDTSLIINKIAIGTNNRLNIIKNVIMPYVKNYKSLVTSKVNTIETVSKLNKYKIVEQETPEIIRELKDKGIVDPKVLNVDIGITAVVVPAPKEDVKSFVKFKNPVLDQMLDVYTASMDDKYIINLWDKVLGSISSSNQFIIGLNNNSVSKLGDILALFALVTNIKTEKQPGVRVSDSSYLTAMDLLHKYLSDIINRVNDRITLDEKYEKLIIGSTDNVITVHSNLYDKFLENNNPEVILGLLYSGDAERVVTLEAITVDANKYEKTWDNAIKRENFRQMSEAPSKYRMVYELTLDGLYKEFDADDAVAPFIKYNLAGSKLALKKLLDRKSDKYIPERLMDIDYMTREILGEIIFKDTMLDKFLDSMYAYHTINSKLTMEELTTMSTIDMIVEYLFSQITIENA